MILWATSVRITLMDAAIISRIVQETSLPENSVAALIALFEKGATGPFVVRYRKEETGGLDETKVRLIYQRMVHYREVLDQQVALLKLLNEQGKLTEELKATIEGCFSRPELDDLHHRFRPRKKTRAAEAIEKGLESLAEYFWNQEPDASGLEEHVNVTVDPTKGVTTQEQALQGAIDIIAERIWGNFEYRKVLREMLWNEGFLVSKVVPAKVGQKTKYTMYYDRKEPVTTVPSHRVLAIRRGCKEGILISSIEGDNAKAIDYLLNSIIKDKDSLFAPILEIAARESYSRILRPLIETEVRTQLKERADREAIRVFQENLANLLLSPPAGRIVVMGIDWGKGDDCSVAVVSEDGKFLEGAKIRFKPVPERPAPKAGRAAKSKPAEEGPKAVQEDLQTPVEPVVEPSAENPVDAEPSIVEGQADLTPPELTAPAEPPETEANPVADKEGSESPAEPVAPVAAEEVAAEQVSSEPVESTTEPVDELERARMILKDLVARNRVRAISIGAGISARELETALRQIMSEEELGDILIAAVNDSGIAIYSSSRLAREEFPDWSASARCAVSLARRLQDPLAELVKIDPKLIGVGQYQHDVDQKELHRGLLQTVQYCVNKVGVNVNEAGESLLRYVSGLNEKLARKLAACRASQGPFASREGIMQAMAMDKTTFEQCAAFLRIPGAENALDRTAVHPESYPIVEKMAASLSVPIGDLIGNKDLISSLRLEEFVSETIGIPTLHDIREELLRPGRDPRKTFKIPKFRADVREMSDLTPGMTLEGTVTNVTNFGAFVDIGVRQDGLVHLSQMSNRFIRDPREAVKVGDVVQVKVISVEMETKRIGLSMKALLPAPQRRKKKQPRRGTGPQHPAQNPEGVSSQASAEANPSSPAERRFPAGSRPRHGRRHDGRPFRGKGSHRAENTEEIQQKKETAPKGPEPSLQEKIAILQSKFRGIQ